MARTGNEVLVATGEHNLTRAWLSPGRRLLLVGAICGAAAWLAGPPTRWPVAMALLLLAPGYLLERALPAPRCHPLLRGALWVGGSLSAVALLYAWLWPLGLALDGASLGLLAGGLAAGTFVAAWHELGAARPAPHEAHPARRRAQAHAQADHDLQARLLATWPPAETAPRASQAATHDVRLAPRAFFWLLLATIVALTVWTRFTQIEGLALPPWVDSVHHALMIRVAAETGRAPISLEPYLPVRELPYHWGYHVFVATLMQLGGLGLPETLLWPGQVLNALHAPLAGALALTLWRRPTAALGAALVVGLISTMPAYYLSWGRYTQLTGLLLLPALALAWQRGLAGAGLRWWGAAALLLAGLSLIHMRVLAFAGALLAAQSIVWATSATRPQLRAGVLGAAAASIGALGLAAPWMLLLVRRALLPALASPASLTSESSYNVLNLAILWVGHNPWLAAGALGGALWGLWQRQRTGAILPLWIGLLLVLANPALLGYAGLVAGVPLLLWGLRWRRPAALLGGAALLACNPWSLRVPANWLINNDSVLISLFLPLSVGVGGGAAALHNALEQAKPLWLRRTLNPLAVALLLLVAGWGAWQQRSIVNEATVLATPADRAAVEWAASNTPADARFLINAASWLGVANRGTDGGWWLLPLAARWTSTPPALFTYGPLPEVEAAIARSRVVIAYKPGGEQAILDLIRRERISHLFFGSKPGPLSADVFAKLPGFVTLYQQDGVTILAVES